MSGIRKVEIQTIVEFLYSGETIIADNKLERFLEISRLLQIKEIIDLVAARINLLQQILMKRN